MSLRRMDIIESETTAARSQHLVGAIRKFKIAQVKLVNVNAMGVIDKTAENNALNILGKSSC